MNESPKPRRGRPQTLDADKVLDVAMNAYWQDDPADVSINTICGMANASKPAIYREFGNEDGLKLAVLNRYADKVLFDIFEVLSNEMSLKDTLNALIDFSSQDPKMETGCLFYKMRAGKHRLGPQTLQRINEINAIAIDAFTAYLEKCRTSGEWESEQSSSTMARYLVEQIGLAFTQRAAGENPAQVHQTMSIALAVF
jgi:AcrR family transcriptional regulator